MFDRKDISAAEARGLVAGVNWDIMSIMLMGRILFGF